MKKIAFFAALAFATPLSAQNVCEMGDARIISVFEPAKAAFLAGDFNQFAELTTRLMPAGPAAFGDGINQLAGLFPDGFESCQTIVQRHDAGGMVQEVTTFNIRGNLGPMSLYLMAAPLRGELEISNINFNTTMSEVLDSLR